MANKSLYIGIDGGGSSCKLVLIDETEQILSKFVSGSCNKNYIGFKDALKNVSEGISGLLTLAKRASSEIAGICMTTAGCTMASDKLQWKTALTEFLNDDKQQVSIEVHNDSVGDIASVSPKRMCGIVCIVGTGFIVCGYNGDPNAYIRAGGWGPLFGDDASGYFMGEKVLKAAGLYYDICGDEENRYKDTEEKAQRWSDCGASEILYHRVMNKAGVKVFGAMVDWAYNKAKDKYKQVAECALIALECYNKCKVAQQIIDNAIAALVLRLLLVLNKMYPKEEFHYDEVNDMIQVVCGGSILLKNELFFDLLRTQLMWRLAGDGRQSFIEFVKPQRTPQLGGALYIKHKCETQ